MYEAHKYDSRWTIKDKLSEYRSIVSLCERDKSSHIKELKKEITEGFNKICNLKRDVHFLHTYLNEQALGDKSRLRAILQEDRRFFLTFQDKHPLEIIANLQQRNCLKIKKINKLRHNKKLRMGYLEKNLVEIEEINRRRAFNCSDNTDNQTQQILINQIENTIVRHNAEKCVNNTFTKMVTLMKEDSLYLNHMVEVLSRDADEQSQCIIDVRKKGEHAIVENTQIRTELQALEEETVKSMKLRDRVIRQLSQQVHILEQKLHTIGEEEPGKRKKTIIYFEERISDVDDYTPLILNQLNEIIKNLQDATVVTDYTQIFSRIKDQLQQNNCLKKQLDLYEKQLENFIKKRDHAKESLAAIKHTRCETDKRNEQEEAMLRKQLKELKETKTENNLKVEEYSRKVLKLRAEIISLSELVRRVRILDATPSLISFQEDAKIEDLVSRTQNPIQTLELVKDKVERLKREIGTAVAEWPSRRVMMTMDITDLDKGKQVPEVNALKGKEPGVIDEAKLEYHFNVMESCTKAHFRDTDDYDYQLDDDIDIDAGFITRMDIKLASQRIVKNFETPLVRVSSKKGLLVLSSPKKPPIRKRWLKCH